MGIIAFMIDQAEIDTILTEQRRREAGPPGVLFSSQHGELTPRSHGVGAGDARSLQPGDDPGPSQSVNATDGTRHGALSVPELTSLAPG